MSTLVPGPAAACMQVSARFCEFRVLRINKNCGPNFRRHARKGYRPDTPKRPGENTDVSTLVPGPAAACMQVSARFCEFRVLRINKNCGQLVSLRPEL